MSKERHLRIRYDAPLDSELDSKLIALLVEEGWTFWAAGYTYEADVRDLDFEKEVEE